MCTYVSAIEYPKSVLYVVFCMLIRAHEADKKFLQLYLFTFMQISMSVAKEEKLIVMVNVQILMAATSAVSDYLQRICTRLSAAYLYKIICRIYVQDYLQHICSRLSAAYLYKIIHRISVQEYLQHICKRLSAEYL